MRIFISGPYTNSHPRQVLKNINAAIEVGIEVMSKGHSVFIPHYSHYMHIHPKCNFEYTEYMINDLEWLKVSDAILYLSPSPGADMELALAQKWGLQVYYYTSQIPGA